MATMTLAEIAEPKGLIGGPFGSNLVGSDYASSGVPVIRGTNMRRVWVDGDFAFVSDAKADRDLGRNVAVAGDLVFTQRGTLGQVAQVPEGRYSRYVISQSQMRLRVDQSVADPTFVRLACESQDFLKQVMDNAISTGVPHINLGILGRLTIPKLPLPEQRAIAEVLGALDDKVAANDRLVNLFDALTRSEFLGLAGEVVALSTLAANPRFQADPAAVAADTTYLGLEHLPRRRMWTSEEGVASDVTSGKSEFQPGDVLFGKLRPYFHKVVAAPGHGICSTDILVVRAKEPTLAGFVLAACASDEAVAKTSAATEGTRMPRTNWKDLGAVGVPWPGEIEAGAFSAAVIERNAWAQSVAAETRTLARTRDALLPLLMSGKLRVKHVEREIAEVL